MRSPLLEASDALDRAVRRAILAQPPALAFALSSYADAEGSGEGEVFTRALRRVTEPRLQAMICKHQEDELRHAALFDARREALGLAAHAIPDHLKIIDLLSDAAGGVLDAAMDTDEDVARVYLLLYVVEERALDEFGRSARAFAAAGDFETAALFAAVARDEERHVQYCEAVGRRHLADPSTWAARLDAMRAVERRVYAGQTRAWTWHLLRSGLLRLPRGLDRLVRGVLDLSAWLDLPAPAPVSFSGA
ncbi:MAG TPA: hypothetical protein PKA64_07810 [Myxococcota bacterium]|nr:hypothetical protein [Myxococcota bacterium]